MLHSDLNLYIRAGSYESVLDAAGVHKKKERCSVKVNGQEICKVEGTRGFNIHVIDPYGEEITHVYEVFDVYNDKSKVQEFFFRAETKFKFFFFKSFYIFRTHSIFISN